MAEVKAGIVAIKKYLEMDGDKIPMAEVKAFWEDCSDKDKAEMGQNAADIVNAAENPS